MYGIIQDLEKLLSARGFWYTVILLNVYTICMGIQPLFLTLTIPAVLLLYLLVWAGKAVHEEGILWGTLLCVAFVATGVVFGALMEYLNGLGLLGGLALNMIFWVFLRSVHRVRKRQQEAERQRLREHDEQRHRQEDRERQAREQEQADRLAAERERRAAEAQRRRDEARARCEAFYRVHAPELRDRFPKAEFEEFVARYMNDRQPPDDVERRAEELKGVIRQHSERIEPPKKKMRLADIAEWFLKEKAQIDATPLAEEDKEALVAHLEARYAKLQETYIRSMEP